MQMSARSSGVKDAAARFSESAFFTCTAASRDVPMVLLARNPSSIRLTAPRRVRASSHRASRPSSNFEASCSGKFARKTLSGREASIFFISCQISSAVKLRMGASIRVRAERTSHMAVWAPRRSVESVPSV